MKILITRITTFIFIDKLIKLESKLSRVKRFNSFHWFTDYFYINIVATDYNYTSFFVEYYKKNDK